MRWNYILLHPVQQSKFHWNHLLYSEDTEKTAKLIDELPYFGIKLKPIQFGKSKTDYSYDKNTNEIYKGIYSVKYCNAKIADELLEVSRKNPKNFIELLSMLKETSVSFAVFSVSSE